MLSSLSVINLIIVVTNVGSLNRMFLYRVHILPSDWHIDWARLKSTCISLMAGILFVIGLTAAGVGLPATVLAEGEPSQAPQTAPVLSGSPDITADQVDRFAQAYLQILQLLDEREPELPAAQTNAEALKVEQSIEADAIAAIENVGLTLPEYMQILELASRDAAFRDKVLGSLDESLEESPD